MVDMYPQPPDHVFIDFHVLHVCTSPRHILGASNTPDCGRYSPLVWGYPYNVPLRGTTAGCLLLVREQYQHESHTKEYVALDCTYAIGRAASERLNYA